MRNVLLTSALLISFVGFLSCKTNDNSALQATQAQRSDAAFFQEIAPIHGGINCTDKVHYGIKVAFAKNLRSMTISGLPGINGPVKTVISPNSSTGVDYGADDGFQYSASATVPFLQGTDVVYAVDRHSAIEEVDEAMAKMVVFVAREAKYGTFAGRLEVISKVIHLPATCGGSLDLVCGK